MKRRGDARTGVQGQTRDQDRASAGKMRGGGPRDNQRARKGGPSRIVVVPASKVTKSEDEDEDEEEEEREMRSVARKNPVKKNEVVSPATARAKKMPAMKKTSSEAKVKSTGEKGGLPVWTEDEDEEEDEDDEPTKSKAASKKKQLFEASEEEEEEDEDDDEEEEDEDDEEEEEDEEDNDESDSDQRVRLTHMGEEVEDDFEGLDDEDDDEEEDEDEGESDKTRAMLTRESDDPKENAARIKEMALALADFKAFRQRTNSSMSRSEMVGLLSQECAAYYGYLPELIDMFLTLFGPTEMVEFLEANETPRPLSIRANTLKTTRRALAEALTARGVGLEPVGDWTNIALKVFESQIPIGATPEYLAGHYMIQSPSSLTPVIALDPRPGERILDMCAAPGGKTSHIAQLMKNEGFLVASDAKLPRIDALAANLARLGVRNAVCAHQDGRDYPKVLGGFDRVLLDAPCSGLGVISHDPSVKQSRTLEDIMKTAQLQRELVLAAIDSCDHRSKTGGIVVYSTCSISVQENEEIVQYALSKRDVELVDSGFELGRPGLTNWQGKAFHPSMKLAKRLYPHTHNMDGFFIAKLRKLSGSVLDGGKPVVAAVTTPSSAPNPASPGKQKGKRKSSSKPEHTTSNGEEEEEGAKKQKLVGKRRSKEAQAARKPAWMFKRNASAGGSGSIQRKGKKTKSA